MFTIPQIINIAKTSLYLASVDVQKGYLYSPRVIPESPKMIYMELKALEWAYQNTLNVESQSVVGINYRLTLSGVPNAGDVVSILMKNSLGANETFTYTVVQGDTILDIYQGLEPLILASPLFNASIIYSGNQPLYLEIDSDSGVTPVSGTTTINLISNLNITQTANYVYSICRGYNLEALKILGINYPV